MVASRSSTAAMPLRDVNAKWLYLSRCDSSWSSACSKAPPAQKLRRNAGNPRDVGAGLAREKECGKGMRALGHNASLGASGAVVLGSSMCGV